MPTNKTTSKTTKPAPKAPAPRGRKRKVTTASSQTAAPAARRHTKPAVSREAQQAEQVAGKLYAALTAPDAPRANAMGYVMGATTLLKMLIDQAEKQGEDRGQLRSYALNLIARI